MCLMCQGMSAQEVFALTRSRILEHGFTMNFVEGEGDKNPPFAYTVGLSRWDHPEVICFNMCPECSNVTLTPIARAVIDRGERFSAGSDLDALYGPEEWGAEILEFPDSSTHLLDANHFYRKAGGPPVPALQVLWPRCVPLLRGHPSH